MKLLFDENLSYRLVRLVADAFPGSEQVKRLGLLHKTDGAIWQHARQHEFVIVTQDEDFENLSLVRGAPPYVLLLRTGNTPTNDLAAFILRHAAQIQESLLPGSDTHCLTLYRVGAE